MAFDVPYSYELTPTKAVPALVRAFGGPLGGTEPALRDVITVALDGTGDFASIRAAVGAIPANNPRAVTVLLQPGIYHEPSVIWGDRRNITLAGATGNAGDVVLSNSEGVTCWWLRTVRPCGTSPSRPTPLSPGMSCSSPEGT